ncbi:MAG: hypothetical protein K6E46_07410 [Lachnospiraceae bacterium]|nr:hypothetical protein [Lachnospiraceae bacterium]
MTQQVVKFKKPFRFNSATVIFAVMSIYLIILIVSFALDKHASTYEVNIGNIASYYSYRAMAIRNEKVVTSAQSGYINYFAEENRKASAKTVVYSISNEKTVELSNIDTKEILTEKRLTKFTEKLDNFAYSFNEGAFSTVYSFKDAMNAIFVEGLADSAKAGKLSPGMSAYYAFEPGVVVYSIDGLENVNVNDFTKEQVKGSNYSVNTMLNGNYVNAGDPVYKVITGETWYLIAKIDENCKEELSDKQYVKVKFKSDNFSMEVPFSLEERDNETYIIIECLTGMIRYASQRYIDIDLDIETVTGYKIPNSSIMHTDFYSIPEEYLTKGGNSGAYGVLLVSIDKETKEETVAFTPLSIYAYDEDLKQYFIHDAGISLGDMIVRPNSSERYKLTDSKKFECVYCVNKGYAVLKLVTILTSNEDYSIVKKGTTFGISSYDRIVLDATKIEEGELIN